MIVRRSQLLSVVAISVVALFVPLAASALAFASPLSLGSRNEEVSALQQTLQARGYYTYPAVTGYFGPITQAAVAAFQRANGLEPVGSVGPLTRALLNGGGNSAATSILIANLLTQIEQLQTQLDKLLSHQTTPVTPSTMPTSTSTPNTPTSTVPATDPYQTLNQNAPTGGYTPGFGGGGGQDIISPVITSIATSSVPGSTITITWTTDEPATSQVLYGPSTAYGSSSSLDSSLVTSHTAVLTGLSSATMYHFAVTSEDARGNSTTSSDQTFITLPSHASDFTAVLQAANSSATLAVLGDSTGNGTDEWVYLLTDALATNFSSTYAPTYYLWDDATSAYSSPILFNRTAGTTRFSDTFDRADGALGTTSSGGQTWAANSWTISSNQAVPNAASSLLTSATLITDTSFIASVDIKAQTTGDYRLYTRYGSASSYLMISYAASGALTINVNTGSGNTLLASGSGFGLTAGTMYTLTVIEDGLNIEARLNGKSVTATLSSAQHSALTGQKVTLTSVSSVTGHVYDNLSISALSVPTNTLAIYNASHPGATISYHTPLLASTLPASPDVAIINLGHNPDTDATTFLASYQDFIAAIEVRWPNTPIIAVGQNARTDASASTHAERMQALKDNAPNEGWDFIDVYTAFVDSGLGLATLLLGDGIHPSTQGSTLWEQTAAERFGL